MQNYNWLEAVAISEDMLKTDKKKLPVFWISAQDCTGCIAAFTRSHQPSSTQAILDFISLEYGELLSVASGAQVESHKENIIKNYQGEYVLVVEGSIPLQDGFLMIAGKSVKEEILHAAKHAKAVIAVGTCSAYGGVAAAEPNPTGAVSLKDILPEDKPCVVISGCPPIPEIIIGTLLHIYFHGEIPDLDRKNRPKVFYQTTVHTACHRKPFFDQKLFAESYDDEGFQKGYCLLKLGCKGPTAFNACETIGWNGVKCSPLTAGFACIGCSEKGFWDKGGLRVKKK